MEQFTRLRNYFDVEHEDYAIPWETLLTQDRLDIYAYTMYVLEGTDYGWRPFEAVSGSYWDAWLAATETMT